MVMDEVEVLVGGKKVFLWMAGGVGVKDRAFDEVIFLGLMWRNFWAN